MPNWTAEDYADLFNATEPSYGEKRYTMLANKLQEYLFFRMITKNQGVSEDSGSRLEWRISLRHGSQSTDTTPFDGFDVYNDFDSLVVARVEWKIGKANIGQDIRLIGMQSAREILNLKNYKEKLLMADVADWFEPVGWNAPTPGSNKPFGIKYYIVPNDNEGFFGQNPVGFNDVAGLDSSQATFERWRNRTGTYATFDATGLLNKMFSATLDVNFESPVEIPSYTQGEKYGYYTVKNVLLQMHQILRNQNQNLGGDLLYQQGVIYYNRIPVRWVPQLDQDTSWNASYPNAIFGINWKAFSMTFLTGWKIKFTPWHPVAGNRNIIGAAYDWVCQLRCWDRRQNFVLYKV